MGDYNSSSPTVIGMEWRPYAARLYTFDSSVKGLACRFRSTGTSTISALHQVAAVTGGPGVGLEIVDTLVPTPTTITVFPGTNTGAVTTGWQNAGIAPVFTDLDQRGGGLHTVTTVPYGTNQLRFRGATTALVTKRPVQVVLKAVIGNSATTTEVAYAQGGITLAGVDYLTAGQAMPPISSPPSQYTLGIWPSDPSTGLPWTLAAVNNLIGGTDSFGVSQPGLYGGGYGGSIYTTGYWLEVTYVTENRKGFFYTPNAQQPGWTKQTLTATSALANNTWYWVVMFGLGAIGSGDSLRTALLGDPNVIMASSPSSSVGEHRQVSELTLGGGGVATAATATVGEMFGYLLDVAGTIQSQSQAYNGLTAEIVYAGQGPFGQTITMPSATAYGAIKLVLGWQDINNRPDGPVTFQIQHGAGMLGGTGTVDVTAVVQPGDFTPTTRSGTTFLAAPVQVPITFTPGAGTQYAVVVTSTATAGRGWYFVLLDTNSPILVSGTTQANVEGASQGGATDTLLAPVATAYTRYDAPMSLVVAPPAPGSPAAVARAAQ